MNEKEKAPGKGNKPDEEAQAIDDAEAEGIAGGVRDHRRAGLIEYV